MHFNRLKHCLLFSLSIVTCLSAHDLGEEIDPVEAELVVVGATEYLYIKEANFAYDARVDTGATTCSIHAEDIAPFERDGEQWVKFTLVNFDTKERTELKKAVVRVAKIKQHKSETLERYVVHLSVLIAGKDTDIEFSLTNRKNYSYPLLVGRNLLRGVAVVDVSQSYTLKKHQPEPAPQSTEK